MDEIVAHAKDGFPDEVCGLLAGRNDVIQRLFRITNIDKSSISYMMEPAEQFKAFKEMRQEGLELLAIYHSHPTSAAQPSQTDIRLAYYPDAVYIIASMQKVSTPEIKGFRIVDNRISEEILEIIP